MARQSKAATAPQTAEEKPYKFFLNGEPVDTIPQWALDKMAERLSRVVSQHFAQHPDEYERFLRSREKQKQLKQQEGEPIKES